MGENGRVRSRSRGGHRRTDRRHRTRRGRRGRPRIVRGGLRQHGRHPGRPALHSRLRRARRQLLRRPAERRRLGARGTDHRQRHGLHVAERDPARGQREGPGPGLPPVGQGRRPRLPGRRRERARGGGRPGHVHRRHHLDVPPRRQGLDLERRRPVGPRRDLDRHVLRLGQTGQNGGQERLRGHRSPRPRQDREDRRAADGPEPARLLRRRARHHHGEREHDVDGKLGRGPRAAGRAAQGARLARLEQPDPAHGRPSAQERYRHPAPLREHLRLPARHPRPRHARRTVGADGRGDRSRTRGGVHRQPHHPGGRRARQRQGRIPRDRRRRPSGQRPPPGRGQGCPRARPRPVPDVRGNGRPHASDHRSRIHGRRFPVDLAQRCRRGDRGLPGNRRRHR